MTINLMRKCSNRNKIHNLMKNKNKVTPMTMILKMLVGSKSRKRKIIETMIKTSRKTSRK